MTTSTPLALPDLDVGRWMARPQMRVLDNGLRVLTVADRRAPLVATALVYGAGTRDEHAHEGGAAHFLEHMMFKGSDRFGPGEIDRVTRSLGGSNNAYTSHDLTLYYFTFAADRWQLSLDVEADRMRGLLLDAEHVEAERQVIFEEIAMYEGEPWSALGQAAQERFFGDRAYARPVLGTRDDLRGLGAAELGAFHHRLYRPSNAVLVVVGDIDVTEAQDRAAKTFGVLDDTHADALTNLATASAVEIAGGGAAGQCSRLERRHGEMSRLLLGLPSPAADHPDHAALRLAWGILGSGRSSRLHRALVDDGQLCVWVSADLEEQAEPGMAAIAAELLPGSDAARVEALILEELTVLRRQPPSVAELERARRVLLADWVFSHERVEQQAFLWGTAATLFDLDSPQRYLERLLAVDVDAIQRVAQRYLNPERHSVTGWSLPRVSAAELVVDVEAVRENVS